MQGTTRKAATVAALVRFPFFFHTQPVRVRGKPTEKDGLFQLEHEGARVWLMPGGTGKLPDSGQRCRDYRHSTSTSDASSARTPG